MSITKKNSPWTSDEQKHPWNHQLQVIDQLFKQALFHCKVKGAVKRDVQSWVNIGIGCPSSFSTGCQLLVFFELFPLPNYHFFKLALKVFLWKPKVNQRLPAWGTQHDTTRPYGTSWWPEGLPPQPMRARDATVNHCQHGTPTTEFQFYLLPKKDPSYKVGPLLRSL